MIFVNGGPTGLLGFVLSSGFWQRTNQYNFYLR